MASPLPRQRRVDRRRHLRRVRRHVARPARPDLALLEYLEHEGKTYDLVIVDTSAENKPPERYLRREALAEVGLRKESTTVVAMRWQGEPAWLHKALPRYAGALESTLLFSQAFGSGVRNEVQNLYLLASAAPANLVDLHGIAAWPLFEGCRSTPARPRHRCLSRRGRAG